MEHAIHNDNGNEVEPMDVEAAGDGVDVQPAAEQPDQLVEAIQQEPAEVGNQLLAPYICNTCRDYVRGGVITICGHLFCWTCLWAQLHNRVLSRCPFCKRRLLLHEDIIPFLSEGPNAGPDDANINAQPGNVPRPSGLYLANQQYPVWFAVDAYDEMRYMGTNARERSLALIVQRMYAEFPRSMEWIKALLWFQLALALAIFYLWIYMMSLSE